MRMPSRQEFRLILYALGAAAVVAVIAVIILAGVQRRRTEPGVGTGREEQVLSGSIKPEHLIIPKEYTEVWRQDWVPYREQRESWSREEIDPYWSDTKEVILEMLERQTVDTLMRNLSTESDREEIHE